MSLLTRGFSISGTWPLSFRPPSCPESVVLGFPGVHSLPTSSAILFSRPWAPGWAPCWARTLTLPRLSGSFQWIFAASPPRAADAAPARAATTHFPREASSSASVSFRLSSLPRRPDHGARVAVRQLLPDSIYFFLMLNTIIHSHNGMSSALIVIIRLFYTLTALDMKRNCWMPGYVFHYLTPFSVTPCPCGIWHTSSS